VLPNDPVRFSSKVDSVSCLYIYALLFLALEILIFFFYPSRLANEGCLVIGRMREWVPPKLMSLRFTIEHSFGEIALISASDFLLRSV
jgi:hypothetical protein